MNARIALCAAFTAVFLSACGDTPDDPVNGSLRFVHAAASQGGTDFLLEERTQGTLNYAGASTVTSIDAGPYDLHLETLVSDSASPVRSISFVGNIEAETEHTYVLYDDNGTLSITEYTAPQAVIEGTNVEVRMLNAVVGSGALDFYLEAEGADLSAATPRASVTYKQISPPFTVTSGVYRLTITEAGNAAAVLFESAQFTSNDATATIMAAFAGAGQSTAAIRASSLVRGNSTPLALIDSRTQSELRVINAALTAGPLDVVVDGDFANPLHAAIAPGTTTGLAALTTGDRQIQVTPAGNMGVIESDLTISVSPAVNRTQLVAGTDGAITSNIYADDNRGFTARARYRVRHGASSFSAVDFYLHEPGLAIADASPQARGLQVTGSELIAAALPDDYEISIVLNDSDSTTTDTTVIAGPLPVTFDESRVYEIVLFDNATQDGIDISLLDVTFVP